MRERLIPHPHHVLPARITPAYAGKTIIISVTHQILQDHPRVCGKDRCQRFQVGNIQGSPPRMRERPKQIIAGVDQVGITPAYAGKTIMKTQPIIASWDHPRVCGKDFSMASPMGLYSGSPPRMRERQRRCLLSATGRRITPAYAGKTKIRSVENSTQQDHPRVCGKDATISSTTA